MRSVISAFPAAMLGMLLAAAGASAQGHRYFVGVAGPTGAELVDMASQARSGDVVRVNAVLLRREPLKMDGFDAYWLDGVEDVDCAAHKSRLMLLNALSLDRLHRTRVGSSPSSWLRIRPGSTGAQLEAFLCRGVRSDRIRAVADLGAFQRTFFQAVEKGRIASSSVPTTPRPR